MSRYGVKNKGTTEQAFFNCNICECELKSVVTLRAHCKGTQHVRKALQKKKVKKKSLLLENSRITQEYRDAQKKKNRVESRSSETMNTSSSRLSVDTSEFTTLFQWLDSATSEAVVGLEQVDSSFLSDPGKPGVRSMTHMSMSPGVRH